MPIPKNINISIEKCRQTQSEPKERLRCLNRKIEKEVKHTTNNIVQAKTERYKKYFEKCNINAYTHHHKAGW
jgi:hypothetical protein